MDAAAVGLWSWSPQLSPDGRDAHCGALGGFDGMGPGPGPAAGSSCAQDLLLEVEYPAGRAQMLLDETPLVVCSSIACCLLLGTCFTSHDYNCMCMIT